MTGRRERIGSSASIAFTCIAAAALASACREPAPGPAPVPASTERPGDEVDRMTREEFERAFNCGECFGHGYLTERTADEAGETSDVTTSTLAFVDGEAVALPEPHTYGGAPLMTALLNRRSSREFSTDPIPLDVLSDLLWAATGVNRKDSGKLTAPTAINRQNLTVYVATARGLYRYNPQAHSLVPVVAGDLRAATGSQAFAATVPVNLVFVSDDSGMPGDPAGYDGLVYAGSHAGAVSQNVYLFAASAGLATVVRGAFDRPGLEAAMGLPPTQHAVLTQSVGYPAAD